MKGSSLLAPIAKRLEGKVALITGGASGIGASSARLFARHGAKVVIADINDHLGLSVASDINLNLPDSPASYVHCDVTSEPDVENAVNDAVSRHGALHVMFSNAGVGGSSVDPTIASLARPDFARVFDVNVYGALLCAKHAARVMVPARRGSVVFTCSVASVTGGGAPHAYAASKAAVLGVTRSMCAEMGAHGVRVNCVSPYGVATPLVRAALGGVGEEAVEGLMGDAANLKGVVMRVDDVAEAALYLASDEARYVSGLNLVVDGGYSTTNVALGQSMGRFLGLG